MRIYKAIEKLPKNLEGGHTKPWLVNVITEHGLKPYVVKFFKYQTIEEIGAVSKEVFGNILARALDLEVPECALIDFQPDFLASLSTEDRRRVEESDQRLKFGSEYISGAVPMLPKLPSNILNRNLLDRIYAFDYLINNIDRRESKPNILLTKRGYYLIDHEGAFVINEDSIKNYMARAIMYIYNNHLFFRFLKKSRQKYKKEYFHSFVETLKFASFRELEAANHALESNNQVVKDFDVLLSYLSSVKSSPEILLELLGKQIK